ncbi:MAG: heat-inducible transcription repressor HrcA [Chitinivibrionales bacterium]|nr:heat-inducible transcription repressor HrcA [Chitinivibrionales bacterium]
MAETELTVRERKVLEAIVRNFILSAAPTGSRFLSKQLDLRLSAATLRNVMGDLEDKGFITQPHTSAGRVPTDKGYRVYVDQMMAQSSLPQPLKERIRSIIERTDPTDLHLLMEATTRALSVVTDQLGIILAPRLSDGIFRHIHIFEIEPHRHVLHMTIDSGFVRTLTVEIASEVSQDRLSQACGILNQRFYGLRLAELTEREDEILQDIESPDLGVIRLFVPSIRKMLTQEHDADSLFTEGETNIVLKPEFHAPDQLGAIVEILADRKMLMHLFSTSDTEPGRVVISIGGENRGGMFESFSVVKARYNVGSLEGSVGVLGPKRMPYPFLVAAVDYTSKLLGELHR